MNETYTLPDAAKWYGPLLIEGEAQSGYCGCALHSMNTAELFAAAGTAMLAALRDAVAHRSFATSLAFQLGNPLFWNVLGRLEYRTRALSWLAGGNRRVACYAFALVVFSLGLYRDYLFTEAVAHGRRVALPMAARLLVGPALAVAGNVLVLSSMWRLGVLGTYLGDHFGILMKGGPVRGFPFSAVEHPMYRGATMVFMGYALYCESLTGLLLTLAAALSYNAAARFEGPFTRRIYMRAARASGKKAL